MNIELHITKHRNKSDYGFISCGIFTHDQKVNKNPTMT